jgi:hypothetical protein
MKARVRAAAGAGRVGGAWRAAAGARAGGRDRGAPARQAAQLRIARIDSRSDPTVASTADGSYPQCAMQFAHRGSLPRP